MPAGIHVISIRDPLNFPTLKPFQTADELTTKAGLIFQHVDPHAVGHAAVFGVRPVEIAGAGGAQYGRRRPGQDADWDKRWGQKRDWDPDWNRDRDRPVDRDWDRTWDRYYGRYKPRLTVWGRD